MMDSRSMVDAQSPTHDEVDKFLHISLEIRAQLGFEPFMRLIEKRKIHPDGFQSGARYASRLDRREPRMEGDSFFAGRRCRVLGEW